MKIKNVLYSENMQNMQHKCIIRQTVCTIWKKLSKWQETEFLGEQRFLEDFLGGISSSHWLLGSIHALCCGCVVLITRCTMLDTALPNFLVSFCHFFQFSNVKMSRMFGADVVALYTARLCRNWLHRISNSCCDCEWFLSRIPPHSLRTLFHCLST